MEDRIDDPVDHFDELLVSLVSWVLGGVGAIAKRTEHVDTQVFDHVVHLQEESIRPEEVPILFANLLNALKHSLVDVEILSAGQELYQLRNELRPVVLQVLPPHYRDHLRKNV